MIKITNTGRIPALAIGFAMFAGTAFAGPQMTFGPDDKGTLQLDYKGQFQMTVRDTGSGDKNDDTTTNFNFRRNRLALMGAYGDMLSLYVQTEYTEDQNVTTLGVADANQGTNFQLLDAVMRFKLNDSFHVNVGKFKYNLSRENLEACEMPLTLDRSLFIRTAYTSTRDTGVAVWGNLFNDMFQYRADVMEGRKAVSGATAPSSNFRYSFRGHVTLLDPENTYGYKGTYLGKKKVLTIGGAYQFDPEIAYGDTVTKTDKKDYQAWTVDGFFEYPLEGVGTVTASAAYEDVDLDNAYKGANPDAGTIGINGQKKGWYVKGGYMLPMMPLQFFGRYEKWRFASLNNVFD
ncbi:MAG: selenite/tellurite reduction operon porin ExtI, partial [Desulfuromonadaceae bacterium]|nr:selenite/tellurite reduction operon porin ExtI [Desulfuromonadaceae bacterium]